MATSIIPKPSPYPVGGYDAIPSVTTTEDVRYVTFPTPFPYVPHVSISLYGSSYNRRVHIAAISQNGFSWKGALLSGTSSAAIEINWIAV